ncbi:hypothetical protein SISSUDRAFT_1063225 [Sistotremastrum suecicum HHB10207 ss-3]|nr:hypothetical protein SISSUDRAFT_1063225 [Sistotremastrum suecicum HHB10207 ss-3]
MDSSSSQKASVIRGARACTVCRAAKMKCVGSDDGRKQCQRCERANIDCIFEKHRRGRKPGSRLSEASKMLRRLEKNLNSQKQKHSLHDPHAPRQDLRPPSPINRDDIEEEDTDDDDEDSHRIFPANIIRAEQRQPFFRTILNSPSPSPQVPSSSSSSSTVPPVREHSQPAIPRHVSPPPGFSDPLTSKLITPEKAASLFDALFLRLNPFISLFDPALHSVDYVRSQSPFLFSVLIAAACKYWLPELYLPAKAIARKGAIRAFDEAWKSVEVCQAFSCLTYWKEPNETFTWTYIGYACRMAIELKLNRYLPTPPLNESEMQRRQRRNHERTYLVLWVHDRSLSMQTGRLWMLPEDDLVRNSDRWHLQGIGAPRPEDVTVSAFVDLRRIAAETIDGYYLHRSQATAYNDIRYDHLLQICNTKLTQWMDRWSTEMQQANGEDFNFKFLSLFRLYVRLFINSFGLKDSQSSVNIQPLSICYTSAIECLEIVTGAFASLNVLQYGQDVITVMTAYAAVFLTQLLRNSNTRSQLVEHYSADRVYTLISDAAKAYSVAVVPGQTLSTSASHARFLYKLVAQERQFENRTADQDRRWRSVHSGGLSTPTSPTYSSANSSSIAPTSSMRGSAASMSPSHSIPPSNFASNGQQERQFSFNSSPTSTSQHPLMGAMEYSGFNSERYPGAHLTADDQYWQNMHIELGLATHGGLSDGVLNLSPEGGQYRSFHQYDPNSRLG